MGLAARIGRVVARGVAGVAVLVDGSGVDASGELQLAREQSAALGEVAPGRMSRAVLVLQLEVDDVQRGLQVLR